MSRAQDQEAWRQHPLRGWAVLLAALAALVLFWPSTAPARRVRPTTVVAHVPTSQAATRPVEASAQKSGAAPATPDPPDLSFLPINQPMSGWAEKIKPTPIVGYEPVVGGDDPPRLFTEPSVSADTPSMAAATPDTFFEPPTEETTLDFPSGDGPIAGTFPLPRGTKSTPAPPNTGTQVPEPGEIGWMMAALLLWRPLGRKCNPKAFTKSA